MYSDAMLLLTGVVAHNVSLYPEQGELTGRHFIRSEKAFQIIGVDVMDLPRTENGNNTLYSKIC